MRYQGPAQIASRRVGARADRRATGCGPHRIPDDLTGAGADDNDVKLRASRAEPRQVLVGDASAVAATVLGRLRVDLAKRFKLIPEDRDVFTWVIDFPLVEWNADEKRWDAVHHPFTAPRDAGRRPACPVSAPQPTRARCVPARARTVASEPARSGSTTRGR